jgi:hypothetical protein
MLVGFMLACQQQGGLGMRLAQGRCDGCCHALCCHLGPRWVRLLVSVACLYLLLAGTCCLLVLLACWYFFLASASRLRQCQLWRWDHMLLYIMLMLCGHAAQVRSLACLQPGVLCFDNALSPVLCLVGEQRVACVLVAYCCFLLVQKVLPCSVSRQW